MLNLFLFKGLVIYNSNNVYEELQNYAVVVAMRAINENPDYASVAKKLVDALNRRYRRHWFAVVGRQHEYQPYVVDIPIERSLTFAVSAPAPYEYTCTCQGHSDLDKCK